MDSRAFLADDGVAWQVWAVHPAMIERRAGRERRAALRGGHVRRQDSQVRAVAADAMRDGWLVFQSRSEIRRLPPARDDVEFLSDVELSTLVMDAVSYGLPRRVIKWNTFT